MPPSPACSPDSCISLPRSATSSSPSRSLRQPAATSAASSPSEWPAIMSPSGRPSASQPARLAQKIAGWAKRVPVLGTRERILADDLL